MEASSWIEVEAGMLLEDTKEYVAHPQQPKIINDDEEACFRQEFIGFSLLSGRWLTCTDWEAILFSSTLNKVLIGQGDNELDCQSSAEIFLIVLSNATPTTDEHLFISSALLSGRRNDRSKLNWSSDWISNAFLAKTSNIDGVLLPTIVRSSNVLLELYSFSLSGSVDCVPHNNWQLTNKENKQTRLLVGSLLEI